MADQRSYRIVVTFDPGAEKFVGRIPEIGVSVVAESRAGAIEEAERALEKEVVAAASENAPLSPPIDTSPVPENLVIKLAESLHRELDHQARASGMTVEELAGQMLARALGRQPPQRSRHQEAPRQARSEERPRSAESSNNEDSRGNERGPDRAAPQPNQGAPRGGGDGRGRRREREGYRPELDDKANFLEYLRGLDKGGRGRR